MDIIYQPVRSNLCGQACVAMILNIPIEEAVKLVGKRGLTNTKHIRKALAKHKLVMSTWQRPNKKRENRLYMARIRTKGQWRSHWIVLDRDGTIYDPVFGVGMPMPDGWRVTSIYEIRAYEHESYRARAGVHCHFLGVDIEEPCWGEVRYSPINKYLCVGHRATVNGEYLLPLDLRPPLPEPPPKPEIERDPPPDDICMGDLLDGEQSIPWKDMSNEMVQVVHACVAENVRLVGVSDGKWYLDPKPIMKILCRLFREGRAQHRLRGLIPLGGGSCYPYVGAGLITREQLEAKVGHVPITNEEWRNPWPEEVEALDLSGASDEVVRVLYGVGAEVIDFSMLGLGVRQLASVLYDKALLEHRRRDLTLAFLFDLEL